MFRFWPRLGENFRILVPLSFRTDYGSFFLGELRGWGKEVTIVKI